jgi:hypothetical protein
VESREIVGTDQSSHYGSELIIRDRDATVILGTKLAKSLKRKDEIDREIGITIHKSKFDVTVPAHAGNHRLQVRSGQRGCRTFCQLFLSKARFAGSVMEGYCLGVR